MAKSRLSAAKRKEYLGELLMISPFAVLFFIFTILAVAASIGLSFTNFNMLKIPDFIGLGNYVSLFLSDDVFLIAFKNTLIFAFVTGPVSYFACLLLAWLINDFPRGLRTVLTLIFYAPSVSANMYVIWTYIFSGDAYGVANGFLMRLGIIDEPVMWLTDPGVMLGVVIVVQLWLSLGVGFLSFIAGLQGIDEQLYEAGAVDGIRNRFQQLIYITVPSIAPQLMFGAVMQIAASFGVSTVCSALTGFPSTDYAAHTVVLHMLDYGTLRFEMGYACAIATVLFMVLIGVNLLIGRILRRVGG